MNQPPSQTPRYRSSFISRFKWPLIILGALAVIGFVARPSGSPASLQSVLATPTPSPAKTTSDFTYKGVTYEANITDFSLLGDDVKTADGVYIEGELDIKSRPEGLSGNERAFYASVAVPKTLLKDEECGPPQVHSYDTNYDYNPLASKSDYCALALSGPNAKTIYFNGVGDHTFKLRATGLKAPIDKHKISIMLRPFSLDTAESQSAPEFLVPYKERYSKPSYFGSSWGRPDI
jgi:hypothetical protein